MSGSIYLVSVSLVWRNLDPTKVVALGAQGKVVIYLNTYGIIMHFFWVSENPICSR